MFENRNGTVTLVPLGAAQCSVNGLQVSEPLQLNQGEERGDPGAEAHLSRTSVGSFLSRFCPGAVILLGRTNMFRFNHPKEAAKLREKRKVRPRLRSQLQRLGRRDDALACFPQSGLLSTFSLSMSDLSKSCDSLSAVMLYNPG